ncbi:MAG: hypothetical protein R6W96_09155 [Clostridia bacterium]
MNETTKKVLSACFVLMILLSGCNGGFSSEKNSDNTQETNGTLGEDSDLETTGSPQQELVESGSVESDIATGPQLTYNVSGVTLGACTTCSQAYHGYDHGEFMPGTTVQLWGIIQNRNTTSNAEILARIFIHYRSKEEPQGKYAVDTEIFRIGSDSIHEYHFTAIIPADAHQVKISVDATAAWSSSVKATFSTTHKPIE